MRTVCLKPPTIALTDPCEKHIADESNSASGLREMPHGESPVLREYLCSCRREVGEFRGIGTFSVSSKSKIVLPGCQTPGTRVFFLSRVHRERSKYVLVYFIHCVSGTNLNRCRES